jgi:cytochrome b involved in lipid metabolism
MAMNDSTLPPSAASGANKARQKQAFRQGFGMSDWIRLLKSSSDLAQRKGAGLRRITATEVALHNKDHDGWTILHGKVYNIAPYLLYHPGGAPILKKILGKDGSELFDKYHRWVNVDGLVGPLLLGYLEKEKEDDEDDQRSYLSPKLQEGGFQVPRPRPPMVLQVQPMLSQKDDDDDDEEEDDALYNALDALATTMVVPASRQSPGESTTSEDGFNVPAPRPPAPARTNQEQDNAVASLERNDSEERDKLYDALGVN